MPRKYVKSSDADELLIEGEVKLDPCLIALFNSLTPQLQALYLWLKAYQEKPY